MSVQLTVQDYFEVLGYLANNNRNTLIEAEMPDHKFPMFQTFYNTYTNNYPLPTITTQSPLYIWPSGTNKWSWQLRLYYNSNANLPAVLNAMSTNNNRPSHPTFDKRINDTSFIFDLIASGYILGAPQDINRIRPTVLPSYISNFNHGFNL